EVLLLRGNFEKARDYSSRALALYTKQENAIGQRLALTTQARSLKAAGLFDQSIGAYLSILNLKGAGNQEEVFLELGETYVALNRLDKAKEVFEHILETPTRSPQDEGQALDHLARIAVTEHNLEEAIKLYEQVLKNLDNMEPSDQDSIAATEANLGYVYLKIGQMDQALELIKQATTYLRKHKNWEELAIVANNCKDELILKGNYELALRFLEEFSIPSLKKLKNPEVENQHHYEVALLHHLQGNTSIGVRYWDKNHNRKAASSQKTARFLNSPFFDEKTRKELNRQHLAFLQQFPNS
ncbi:MAG: tetratricopeptide repeat protein, partial [Candidatus Thorarchaeota archaeon]